MIDEKREATVIIHNNYSVNKIMKLITKTAVALKCISSTQPHARFFENAQAFEMFSIYITKI